MHIYSWVSMNKFVLTLGLSLMWPSFKGTDETFGGFPDRLKHILTETIENATVECVIFPAYEARPHA